MGTATVVTLTPPQQARDERAQLLREMGGMTFEEARERAEEYQLTIREVIRWRRIEELTWLLGE